MECPESDLPEIENIISSLFNEKMILKKCSNPIADCRPVSI